jgi:hypothetical protein
MANKVQLLDYVAGNIRSLVNAIEKCGFEVEWIKSPEDVKHADVRIVSFSFFSLVYITSPMFLVCIDSFFILHSSFFILHSSFFILHSSFFILHSSFFILHSSFIPSSHPFYLSFLSIRLFFPFSSFPLVMLAVKGQEGESRFMACFLTES